MSAPLSPRSQLGNGNEELEEELFLKESAKIRKLFHNQKKLDGYERRKAIAKLLFMHLAGYPTDFGHQEALVLVIPPRPLPLSTRSSRPSTRRS